MRKLLLRLCFIAFASFIYTVVLSQQSADIYQAATFPTIGFDITIVDSDESGKGATITNAQRIHWSNPVDNSADESWSTLDYSGTLNFVENNDGPNMQLLTTSIDFGTVMQSVSSTLNINFKNIGTEDLFINNVSSDNSVFETQFSSSLVLSPNATSSITVSFVPYGNQSYSGEISIACNDIDNPTFKVDCTGESIPYTEFVIDPSLVSEDLFSGISKSVTLKLQNKSTRSFNWSSVGYQFAKQENSDCTLEANQLRLSDKVWLTCASDHNLFNAYSESAWVLENKSPAGTKWAYGKSADLSPENYGDYWDVIEYLNDDLNKTLSVHLIEEDLYFDLVFTELLYGTSGHGFRVSVNKPGWLNLETSLGTITASNFQEIELALNASKLSQGIYEHNLVFETDDATNKKAILPITLNVLGNSDIRIEVEEIDFEDVYFGDSYHYQLDVANYGNYKLEISSITCDNPAFSSSMPLWEIDAGGSGGFDVIFEPIPEQGRDVTGTLTLITNSPGKEQIKLALKGSGFFIPNLEASIEELDFGDVKIGTSKILSYQIRGVELTHDVFVEAPKDCEISLNHDGYFAKGIYIKRDFDMLSNTTVYVKYTPRLAEPLDNKIGNHTFKGASEIVALVGQGVLNSDCNIMASTNAIDFNSVLVNQESILSFQIEASNLTEELNLFTNESFIISTNKTGGFGSSLSLLPTNGSLKETALYVKFNPRSEANYLNYLKVASADSDTVYIVLKGQGELERNANSYFTSKPPVLDGLVDEQWEHITGKSIHPSLTSEVSFTQDAIFKSMWDNEYTYVLVEVFDDDFYHPDEAVTEDEYYHSDEVLLHFDINEPKVDGGGVSNKAVGHFLFYSNYGEIYGDLNCSRLGRTANDQKYIIEYRIPHERMSYDGYFPFGENGNQKFNPTQTPSIGFEVELIDLDEEGKGATRTTDTVNWSNDLSQVRNRESLDFSGNLNYVNPSAGFIVSDSEIAFEKVKVKESKIMSYVLIANGLSANVEINSSEGFQISMNPFGDYANSLSLAHANNERIFVKFLPVEGKSYSGTIIHSTSTIQDLTLALSGVGDASLALLSVSADKSNVYYNFSDTINFQLAFDKEVIVDTTLGVPSIDLNTLPMMQAHFVKGNGTNTLTFQYLVGSSENIDSLSYVNKTALQLNGASISYAGIMLDTVLPDPIIFKETHRITIDNIPPIITVESEVAATNLSPYIYVALSEPCSNLSLDSLVMLNARTGQLLRNDTAYTFYANAIRNGLVSAYFKAGAVQDFAGNYSLTSDTASFIFDSSSPALDSFYIENIANVEVNYKAYYNEQATIYYVLRAASEISITYDSILILSDSTLENAGIVQSTDLFVGNIGLTKLIKGTDYKLYMIVKDSLGNGNEKVCSFSTTNIIPTIESITCETPNGYYNYGDTLRFVMQCNVAVNVDTTLGKPTIALNTSPVSYANYTKSVDTKMYFEYLVGSNENVDSLNFANDTVLNLSGASIIAYKQIIDPSLSKGFSMLYSSVICIDNLAPNVQLISTVKATRVSPIEMIVLFSETVTPFTLDSLDLSSGVANLLVQNDTSYTFIVSPHADTIINVQIKAGAVVDFAGNESEASNKESFFFDALAPWVTSFQINGISHSSAQFNATLSEACKFYYMLQLTDDLAPIDEEIVDIKAYESVAKGSINVGSNLSLKKTWNKLSPSTEYTLYTITEDNLGNWGPFNVHFVTEKFLGIHDNGSSVFQIYPNPNYGQFKIVLNSEAYLGKEVNILDVTGTVISKYEIHNLIQIIELGNVSQGIYFIQILLDDQVLMHRFVIE